MSLKACMWVLDNAPCDDAQRLMVLMALADEASSEGTGAFPSVAKVAHRARCSTRTVQRHLRALEDEGLIRRGDQSAVAHLDPRYRPVVWDLNLAADHGQRHVPQYVQDGLAIPQSRGDSLTPLASRGDTGDAPQQAPGVTNQPSRGDTAMSPNPRTNPKDTLTTFGAAEPPTEAGKPLSPQDQVARAVYDQTEGMINYMAVRQVANKALRVKGATVERVTTVMLSLYRANRPLTLATVGQAVQANHGLATNDAHWASGGQF